MMGFSRPTDWCVLPFQNAQPPRVPWLLLDSSFLFTLHGLFCCLLLLLSPCGLLLVCTVYHLACTSLLAKFKTIFRAKLSHSFPFFFHCSCYLYLSSLSDNGSHYHWLSNSSSLIYIMLGFLYAVHSAGNLFLTGSLLGVLVGLKMKAFHSSKMLVDFYQATQHFNPEDCIVTNIRTLNPHRIT